MRLSTGGHAWCRPGHRPRGGTPTGILVRVLVVCGLAITLTGCEVISGVMSQGLRGSRSAPGEAFCLEYQVLPADGQAPTPELLEQTRTIIEERVNATGVAEPIVATQGTDRVSVELPGLAAEDMHEIGSLIGTAGVIEFMPVPAELQGLVGEGPLPEGMLDQAPLFTGVEIDSAAIAQHQATGEFVLDLRLTDTGARLFDEYAADHFGEQLAIVLDDEVISAPFIQAARFDGRAQISGGPGGFSAMEASRLATVLRFGPLPLPLSEVGRGAC